MREQKQKQFVKVSKLEFLSFVKNWPAKLKNELVLIREPPMTILYDESTGVVARISYDWMGPNGEVEDKKDLEKYWQYSILKSNT